MHRISNSILRGAAVLTCAGLAYACTSVPDIITAAPPVNTIFGSYVALGNSITAGYQSGGINDSTQRWSYAFQLAGQMRTRFAYPSLAAPGCPPPLKNFVTQDRQGP